MLTQEFIEKRKQQLLDLKKHLEEQLILVAGHTELSEDDDDIDSAVLEIELDDAARTRKSMLLKHLAKVIKALAKINAGTYGTTDDGKEIPMRRLEVEPEADILVGDTEPDTNKL